MCFPNRIEASFTGVFHAQRMFDFFITFPYKVFAIEEGTTRGNVWEDFSFASDIELCLLHFSLMVCTLSLKISRTTVKSNFYLYNMVREQHGNRHLLPSKRIPGPVLRQPVLRQPLSAFQDHILTSRPRLKKIIQGVLIFRKSSPGVLKIN